MALSFLPGLSLAEGGTAPVSLDFQGGSIEYQTHGSKTRLVISTTQGGHYTIDVTRGWNVPKHAPPQQVSLVGQIDGKALILTETYPSIPGGLDYCQAGQEKILRVISLAAKPPLQTYHTKLESCRQNITLADPGVQWNPDDQILAIHWASSRKGVNQPDSRTLKIGPRDVALKKQ